MKKMRVTEFITEGTLVRAIIISKKSDSLHKITGTIHYERYLGYAIDLMDIDSNRAYSIDLNLMTEYHVAPALEGKPLFINLRIDPDILISLTPENRTFTQ